MALTLYTTGKSIQLAAIQFGCRGTSATGATSLNDVTMKRSKSGYRFSIKAHGSVTYSDGYPEENAAVNIKGQFNRTGKRVSGTYNVDSPRCPRTGEVKWSAHR